MKTYKYLYPKSIIICLILALVLCVVGFALNLYFLIYALTTPEVGVQGFVGWLQYVLIAIITVLFIVFTVTAFIKSYYAIKDNKVVIMNGILKSEFPVDKIVSIHLFKKTKKLTIFFDNERFLVVVIAEELYNDFIDELKKANSKIAYEAHSNDEEV